MTFTLDVVKVQLSGNEKKNAKNIFEDILN